MNLSFRTLLLLSAALLAACPAPEPVPDGGEVTNPPIDAGQQIDAGVEDAGVAPIAKLQVVSPETGLVTFVPETVLEVKVVDAAADSIRVTVDAATPIDIAGPIAAGETRSTTLTLALGVNRIHVEVVAGGEVVAEETTVVFVQESAVPLLDVMTPAQNEVTLRAAIDIAGRIVSSRPIATATVKVGSEAASPLTLTPAAGGFLFTGTAALAIGANVVTIDIADDRGETAATTINVQRDADNSNPTLAVTWPRNGQSVRTRNLFVRGTVDDNAGIAEVEVTFGTQDYPATVAADGTWTVMLPAGLVPGRNEFEVTARDSSGNETQVTANAYLGQRISSGNAHGLAIGSDGGVYGWGRNNYGQTGVNFVSHESRSAWCSRTISGTADQTICAAATISNANALCNNPNFVTPLPDAGRPEAVACRAQVLDAGFQLCAQAGSSAPSTCPVVLTDGGIQGTSLSFTSICDQLHSVGSPASAACETAAICDPVYAPGTAENTNCKNVLNAVPTVYPTPATPYSPTAVALPATPVSVSVGQSASAALDVNGALYTWGDNGSGQLAVGDTTQRISPTLVAPFVPAPAKAVSIVRGLNNLFVIDSSGAVWGTGTNALGAVGDGTTTARTTMVAVVGLPADVVQVVAGSAGAFALTSTGDVWAWGTNQNGNLGNGTSTGSTSTPAKIAGLSDVVMIATGNHHGLALKKDGTVWGWGLNQSKQVSGTLPTPVTTPTRVMSIVDARGVYANGNQSFFEDTQGRLWGWGQNLQGTLGITTDEDLPFPSEPVFGLSGVTDVGIGSLQGMAMRGAQAFAWGWSFHGSLGAGTSAIHQWSYRTPVLVQLP